MAKKKLMTPEDLAHIGKESIKASTNEKKTKPKSKRINIRIATSLYERMVAASEKTGQTKTALIVAGLNSEINRINKE